MRVLRSYPEDRSAEYAHRAPPSVVLGVDGSWRAPSRSPKASTADARASKEGATEVGVGGSGSGGTGRGGGFRVTRAAGLIRC